MPDQFYKAGDEIVAAKTSQDHWAGGPDALYELTEESAAIANAARAQALREVDEAVEQLRCAVPGLGGWRLVTTGPRASEAFVRGTFTEALFAATSKEKPDA